MHKIIKPHQLSTTTGIFIVLANMIGTGVFTSLGFQVKELGNSNVILTLWVTGGLLALAGAFSYAEVGASVKQSGGEYAFLSRLYHPVAGYLAGWISLTVGFAAPIALSAIAFTSYLPVELGNPKLISVAVITAITFIHTKSLKVSASFQAWSTSVKLILIVSIIALGIALPIPENNSIGKGGDFTGEILTIAFAVNLIFVSYAYTGWNAATYITEEFKNPGRSVPLSLIGGTLVVTILYTLLQFVFLKHIPIDQLAGHLDVGTIAIDKMLGRRFSQWFGLAICLLLISGISAMVWIGPRVTSGMAKDHRLWHFFRSDKQTIPKRALWFQLLISAALIFTGTFEEILIYCGVLLNLTSMFVVAGVFILRRRAKNSATDHYKSPLFPFFQLFFLCVSLWMIGFAFVSHPVETLAGMSNLVIGLGTYYWSKHFKRWKNWCYSLIRT